MWRPETKWYYFPPLVVLYASRNSYHRHLKMTVFGHKFYLIVSPDLDCVQDIWANPTAFQPPQADIHGNYMTLLFISNVTRLCASADH